MSFDLHEINNRKDVDIYNNGLYVEHLYNFYEYESELLKYNYNGYYIIKTLLKNGKLLEHKFVFVDKVYNDLLLCPLEIPKENMFNSEQTIIKIEYTYIPFNISNYSTKRNELVDYEGNIRKKEKGEKTIRFHDINFLVNPVNGYDIDKYFNGTIKVHKNNFSEKYQKLMNIHSYMGLYEIVLVLRTGEHINLAYSFNKKEDDYIYLQPIGWEDDHLRNLSNIPSDYILYKNFKYYFNSKRIDFITDYIQHSFEQYTDDELICVNVNKFSNEVLSAINLFGKKGKLIYSCITKDDDHLNKTIEEYEFVKFKKVYQWNQKYVILKTKKLPLHPWYEIELSDIKDEKWEYIIS